MMSIEEYLEPDRNSPDVHFHTQQPLIEMFRRERGDLWTYRTFEREDDVVLASLAGISA